MLFSTTFITQYEVAFTEMVRLGKVGAEKIVEGEDASIEDKRAQRLFICLQALDCDQLSAAQVESLEYCLRRLNYSLAVPTVTAIVTVSIPEPPGEVQPDMNLYGGIFGFTGGDTGLEANLVLAAEAGAFTFTGGTLSFASAFDIILDGGSFAFTGGSISHPLSATLPLAAGTFTFTGGDMSFVDPNELEFELAEAVPLSPSWRAVFEMDVAPFSTHELDVTGNGDTDRGQLSGTTIICTVYKTSNSGIAEDAGDVTFYLNAGVVNTQAFANLDNLNGTGSNYKQYTFTTLVPGDILKAFVTEG